MGEPREFTIIESSKNYGEIPDPAGSRTAFLKPFDSLWEFGEYARQAEARDGALEKMEGSMLSRWDDEWMNCTRRKAETVSREGDESRVEGASRMLDEVDAAIETMRFRYVPAPAGDYYVVPEVLAGLPTPMRRRMKRRGPGLLKIFVDLVSSAGVSHKQLEKRGDACLALASKLSTYRPVELFAVCGLASTSKRFGSCVITFKISASPLNLAVSSAALSCVGLSRGYAYRTLAAELQGIGHGRNSGFPWISPNTRDTYIVAAREALGLSPDDVFVPPPYLRDEIDRDPIEWIRKNVERLQGEEE